MRRGFTLIELLVVVAIIGMLSSVVLAALGEARASARDAKRYSDLRQIATALELYYQENGAYPIQTLYRGTTPGCYNTSANPSGPTIPGLTDRYISSIPQDPRWIPNNYCYLYASNSDGSQYKLLAYNTVETGNANTSGGVSPTDPRSRYFGCASPPSTNNLDASFGIASDISMACW